MLTQVTSCLVQMSNTQVMDSILSQMCEVELLFVPSVQGAMQCHVGHHGDLQAGKTRYAASGGVELLHCSSAVSESQPVLFRKGDVQTVVGTILCKQPTSAVSPATLAVTWQRSRCITVLFPAAPLCFYECHWC